MKIVLLLTAWIFLALALEKLLDAIAKKARNKSQKPCSSPDISSSSSEFEAVDSSDSSSEGDFILQMENRIKEAVESGKTVTIKLSELARIWVNPQNTETVSSEIHEAFPEKAVYSEVTTASVKTTDSSSSKVPSKKKEDKEDEEKELIEALSNAPGIIKNFLKTQILPIKNSLILTKTYIPILRLLTYLAEKCTDCPSVVGENDSKEFSSYAFLEKVSLAEHSINTAEEGIKILQNYYSEAFEITAGKAIIAFLGHDIGKERIWQVLKKDPQAHYSTGEHPRFSAQVLNEIFLPKDLPGREEILYAVHRHHLSDVSQSSPPLGDSKERLLWMLVQADRKAREKELLSMSWQQKFQKSVELSQNFTNSDRTSEASPQNPSYPKGFSPKDLFLKILPYVNKTLTEKYISDPENILPPEAIRPGNFLAVSQPNGIVYVRPDLVYYAFLALIKENPELLNQNAHLLAKKKNEALIDIVNWLQDLKLIPPGTVQKGYIGHYYSFRLGNKEFISFFLPVIAYDAFGVTVSQLEEKRKKDPKTSAVHSFKKTTKSQKTSSG